MGLDNTNTEAINVLQSLEKDRDATIEDYQIQVLNNYQSLYNRVYTENINIEKSYSKELQETNKMDQQSNYIKQSSGILTTIYNWCFWIYIALAIILFILIVIKKNNLTNIQKGLFAVVLFSFPFLIYPLEEIIYKISMYFYNLILSVAYNNGIINSKIEYYPYAWDRVKSV